tara:strand:- start:1206 stop:1460 length:255 start_codon:yes stop_codon:yes gene_type:complete
MLPESLDEKYKFDNLKNPENIATIAKIIAEYKSKILGSEILKISDINFTKLLSITSSGLEVSKYNKGRTEVTDTKSSIPLRIIN